MIDRIKNFLEFPDSEPLRKLKEKLDEYKKEKALNIFITSEYVKNFIIVVTGVAIGSAISNLLGKLLIAKIKKAVAIMLS